MDKPQKPKTVKIPMIISITLSVAIFIVIIFFTVESSTLDQLSKVSIKYEFFLVAVLLNILYWVLWGTRIYVLANTMDKNVNLSLLKSIKIVIANLFLACITPSMAGGEPVRIYLLNKNGMTFGCSTAVVLGERLIDAVFILIMVPIALFIFKDIKDLGVVSLGLTIGVVVFVIFVMLFIYSIINPNKTKSFLIYLSKKFRRFLKKDSESKIIQRINYEVDEFHNSMYCFTGQNKKILFLASILTVMFWSVGFLIPSFVLLGLGLPPFFLESYVAQIILLIIIMLPLTPGSSGVAEVSLYGLYGVLIGTSSSALIGVFIILYRLISFHMNLIAGSIFQYRIFNSVASFSMDVLKKKDENNERK